MTPSLTVRDLAKRYAGVTAVDGLTFEVQSGEIFGLLGPNGAGKTTTIRMVMDIIKPDSGSIRVLGEPPGASRARVGYLPEERGLYRGLRLAECLIYLGELKGMSRAAAQKRTRELLERVELAEWAKRKVNELSRGMQQKAQIVASLVHDPALVILDEPFQGLAPINVELVKGLIRELRAAGKTVVLSAHEMNQVEALCERIALIYHGRAVLYGSLADIKKQFAPNAIELSPPLALDGWPNVLRAETRDGHQTIYLDPQTTPQAFLAQLLQRNQALESFSLASTPLEEIFISVVKEHNNNA